MNLKRDIDMKNLSYMQLMTSFTKKHSEYCFHSSNVSFNSINYPDTCRNYILQSKQS